MTKKYFMDEELREILKNSSDEGYLEDEKGENNGDNNVQITNSMEQSPS
jgi:hypothetical protein